MWIPKRPAPIVVPATTLAARVRSVTTEHAVVPEERLFVEQLARTPKRQQPTAALVGMLVEQGNPVTRESVCALEV